MPLKPDRLERSLKLSQESLALCEKKLDESNVAVENRRRNPLWRKLNSDCKQIRNRIEAANQLVARGQVAPAEPEADEAAE